MLTIPNLISFLRLGLVPVFLWLQLHGEPEWALGVFVVASASDMLDGFLARVLNQRSKLGGILDPVADKLLVFTALITLVIGHQLPWWLFAVMLARDLPMAIGAWVVKLKNLEIPTMPSRIGKYATFSMVLTVVMALLAASPRAPLAIEGYTVSLTFIAGLCVVLSTLQYWARFGYLFFAPERKRSSRDDERRTHA